MDMYTYEYDFYEKEVITECKLYPTDVFETDSPWLYANNYKYENVDYKKTGKWMVFLQRNRVNEIWDKIKMAVTNGHLWQAKVSTTEPAFDPNRYAIMIYTKDYTDLDDVIRVLNFLESSGIKPLEEPIFYKTDEQTRAGIYRGGRQRPWIYSSSTIRRSALNMA